MTPEPFVHRETVRFRDLDSLDHVNNAVYMTYLEEARIAFLAPSGADYTGMILAHAEVDFRSPASLGETLEISVVPAGVGTKSFELSYEIRVGERLVAEARTVLVAYDYERNASRPVPEAWRKLLEQ